MYWVPPTTFDNSLCNSCNDEIDSQEEDGKKDCIETDQENNWPERKYEQPIPSIYGRK